MLETAKSKMSPIHYMNFLDSWIGSSECDTFLKTMLPGAFYKSIHDENWDYQLDYSSAYFIKSFIRMCGLAEQEIPVFDRYEISNAIGTIYGHNYLYKFEIEFKCRIEYNTVVLRFYRNDGRHFLTLKTGSNRSGTMNGFVENYDWLVRECYMCNCEKPKVFRIGSWHEKYGFFILANDTVYFCPYKHEETPAEDEDFTTFCKKYCF